MTDPLAPTTSERLAQVVDVLERLTDAVAVLERLTDAVQ